MVGFFWSTVLLWHGTFTVNSLAHVMGRRRYATTDTSRNSALIALWTGGEGWHNNHHHYQSSARNGFFWWEIDTTYYGLKVLSWFRIVRDLKTPSERVLAGSRVRDGQFDMGMFKAHWARATAALAAARTAPTDAIDLDDAPDPTRAARGAHPRQPSRARELRGVLAALRRGAGQAVAAPPAGARRRSRRLTSPGRRSAWPGPLPR